MHPLGPNAILCSFLLSACKHQNYIQGPLLYQKLYGVYTCSSYLLFFTCQCSYSNLRLDKISYWIRSGQIIFVPVQCFNHLTSGVAICVWFCYTCNSQGACPNYMYMYLWKPQHYCGAKFQPPTPSLPLSVLSQCHYIKNTMTIFIDNTRYLHNPTVTLSELNPGYQV